MGLIQVSGVGIQARLLTSVSPILEGEAPLPGDFRGLHVENGCNKGKQNQFKTWKQSSESSDRNRLLKKKKKRLAPGCCKHPQVAAPVSKVADLRIKTQRNPSEETQRDLSYYRRALALAVTYSPRDCFSGWPEMRTKWEIFLCFILLTWLLFLESLKPVAEMCKTAPRKKHQWGSMEIRCITKTCLPWFYLDVV